MAQSQVFEGTAEQLAHRLLALPGSQRYRMLLTPQEGEEEKVESLEEVIARMTHRTPEEIASVRERILAASPAPRELPKGQTLFDAVMGKWPGDETDEEIRAALEKLS